MSIGAKYHTHILPSGKRYSHRANRPHNGGTTGPPWSKKEQEFLRQNYHSLKAREIAKVLGRPLRGVIWEASRLGLGKNGKNRTTKLNFDGIRREDIAYMAGFIDGEGTITLNLGSSGKWWSPYVGVINTDFNVMDFFAKIFGRRASLKKDKRLGRNDAYGVEITSLREVYEFLQIIYPYLRVKKEQAKLLLEYCKLRLARFQQPLNAQEREIVEKIRELNRRGRLNDGSCSLPKTV
jgi:hypothetical protein